MMPAYVSLNQMLQTENQLMLMMVWFFEGESSAIIINVPVNSVRKFYKLFCGDAQIPILVKYSVMVKVFLLMKKPREQRALEL